MATLDDVRDLVDKTLLQLIINKMYLLKQDFILLLSDEKKVYLPTKNLIKIRLCEIQDELDFLQKQSDYILKKYEKKDKKDDIKKDKNK